MVPPSNDDVGAADRQLQILLQRGEVEAKLMAKSPQSPLAYISCGDDVDDSGLIGTCAKTLSQEGVVGIDHVLSCSTGISSDNPTASKVACTCQQLRDNILDYRAASQVAISQGQILRSERFAKCLLSDHRDDLLLPFDDDDNNNKLGTATMVKHALRQILDSGNVGAVIDRVLGPDAVLFELAALISDPGSARQNVHPDHACSDTSSQPLVLTCFVALQMIDTTMGPTIWIPKTHTSDMHARFQRRRVEDVFADGSPKDILLQSMPHVVGAPMSAGSCGLFDSRLLHAGTANTSASRVLFYFSFKRRDASVGVEQGSLGYGLENAALTVSDILSQS